MTARASPSVLLLLALAAGCLAVVALAQDEQPGAAAAEAAATGADALSAAELAAVRADKAEVDEMMRDPERAADDYFAGLELHAEKLRAAGQPLPASVSAYAASKGSAAAAARYRRNFLATLREVARLNRAAGDDESYGINRMAHLSKAEWARMYTMGRNRRPKNMNKEDNQWCQGLKLWDYSGMPARPLATDVDWRARGRVTAVKDQGKCGGCVVFANMAVIEATLLATTPGLAPAQAVLSEQDMMGCIPGDQCGGAQGWEYIERATCKPLAQAKDVPYREVDDDVCAAATPRASPGIKEWTFVPPNMDDLRRAVNQNVVSAGINADGGAFRNYKRGIMKCNTGGKLLNHEIAIVGYKDQEWATKTKAAKVFIARNSWGDSWGEGGYFRLQADCKAGSRGARSMYLDDAITTVILPAAKA